MIFRLTRTGNVLGKGEYSEQLKSLGFDVVQSSLKDTLVQTGGSETEIELKTLEELLEFIGRMDSEVIISVPSPRKNRSYAAGQYYVDNLKPTIEIYDDYRE